MTTFTYIVIRYGHDAGAGELLNVGVVVYAPREHRAELRVEKRFERLSQTFKGFDGTQYRRSVLGFMKAFRALQQGLSDAPLLADARFNTAADVVRALWPDLGLSFSLSEPRGGVTRDLEVEVAALFDRMVASRYDKKADAPRRTDDQVWRNVYQPAIPVDVASQLHEKAFTTSEVSYKFAHAFKNGAWHVVQPVSMDFLTPESIQRKATQWVGTAVGLEDIRDLAKIYFLLGKPSRHGQAYERAKKLLQKAPVTKEIIEEHEAERFGAELAALVHGHTND
jgi:hypothetical protein